MAADNLIVFDWNGTILADTSACLNATNTVLRKLGLPRASRAQFQHHYTMPVSKLYNALGVDAEMIEKHASVMHPLWHDTYGAASIRLRRGAKAMLHAVRVAKYKAIILSNYLVPRIDAQAQKLGVREHFEEIIAFDQGDPVSRLTRKGTRLQDYVKAHPFKTGVIVGDSEEEIEIGRDMGMTTVAILDGMCSSARLRAMKPDFVIRSLAEIPAITHKVFFHNARVAP